MKPVTNKLDEIKKTKYSPLKDTGTQDEFFNQFMKEAFRRKKLGDEKYGNYMLDTTPEIAYKEFEEEMIDAVNHLIMLSYRVKMNKDRK